MKIKNYPGLAESIYNYRPCSRWGLAPPPSTKGPKGSPRLSAPGWPVPKELQRNSQRCIKRTCHVKANSNNLQLNSYINTYPPIAKHKVRRRKSVPQIGDTQTVDWGDDNRITIWNQMRKSFLARDYALNRSSTPDSTASHVFKRQFYSLLSISNLLLLEKPIRFVSSLLHFNVLHLLHPLSARHLSLASTARSSRLLFAI